MSHVLIAIAALVLWSGPVLSAVGEQGYNQYTIRASDIPKDAPRFQDYPTQVYRGRNAVPDWRSDPDSRQFRTRLKAWAKAKPNFAGHYILATWGCGTDCTQLAIIDARTGKIFHPRGARTNVAVNVDDALLGGHADRWHGTGAVWYRTDSRLIILIGMPEESEENRGISYFVWNEDQLKRIRFVPKPYPQTK